MEAIHQRCKSVAAEIKHDFFSRLSQYQDKVVHHLPKNQIQKQDTQMSWVV